MPGALEPRHRRCASCADLADSERALQHVQPEPDDTFLPAAAASLVSERKIEWRSGHRAVEIKKCPGCATRYVSWNEYEFLIGFGGSYDQQSLVRLSDEDAAEYLEGRRFGPPEGMD